MRNIDIRSANIADGPAIAALNVISWRDVYASILDPAYLRKSIEMERLQHWTSTLLSRSIIQVALDADGELVGFVCALPDADPEKGSRIDNLHVAPQHRGQGIGERLLRFAATRLECEASLRNAYLWVFESNQRAISFYKRLGGEIAGSDFSDIPAALGNSVLCIRWNDVMDLRGSIVINPENSQFRSGG